MSHLRAADGRVLCEHEDPHEPEPAPPLTAIPLGLAFFFRSLKCERFAGLAVVLAILISALVALGQTIERSIHPRSLSHLWLLAAAGVIGFIGNEIAAQVRLRAGHRLHSPALVADGNHARVDGFVSVGVIGSAVVVALGVPVADPIISLLITAVILTITWDSWWTVRGNGHHDSGDFDQERATS